MITKEDLIALKESEELFRLLIETRDYAIVMIDPAGIIRSWNLGAEYITGYSTREVFGEHISLCYPDDDGSQRLDKLLKESLTKGRLELETLLVRKDKNAYMANVIYTPLFSEAGALRGYAVMIRDITVQKHLEDEHKALQKLLEQQVKERTRDLENANKELNAFSYSVSHDLRSPLRAIAGFSKILQEDYSNQLDQEGNRMLKIIMENAEMMGKLIDDLLAFSRLSRLEVIDKTVDMKAVVEQCIEELLQVWPGIKYDISVADLPSCYADPSMMKQVWINLIENAFKYSSKQAHPKIEIGFEEDDTEVTYYIRDNGAGFNMEYAGNLFGVFQRLHSVEEFSGTGLGLALVNRIVSKHGGRVWGNGEEGKGAAFYFTILKPGLPT